MIQELNRHIDQLDGQIIQLIAQRMNLSRDIGKEKQKPGHEVHLKTREIEVLDKVKILGNAAGLDDAFITDLYQVILAKSRRLENLS